MASGPDKYYCTDNAGHDVGDGAGKYALETGTDEEYDSVSLASKYTWNRQTSRAQTIRAGTWRAVLDLAAGSGAGALQVTVTVKIHKANKDVQETIIDEAKVITKGSTGEYTWITEASDVDIENGGYIVLTAQRTVGLMTCNMRFNFAGQTYWQSRIIHPHPCDTVSIDPIPINCRMHHAWRRPEPTAHINCVPHQVIDGSDTFDIGVVVDSPTKTSKVVCRIVCGGSETYNSQSTYTFPDVTGETWNARTSSYEYKITIDNSNFSGDNEFTVEADVHGTNGEIATKNTSGPGLAPISLVCNKNDTYVYATAWVDTGGDDETGVVNNESYPYATIHAAWKDLAAWMLTNYGESRIDRCVVRLAPNQAHQFDRADTDEITTSYAWTIVTCESGQSQSNTRIDATGTKVIPKTKLIKVENVQIGKGGGSYRQDYASYDQWLWVHNGAVKGFTRYGSGENNPIGTSLFTQVPTRMFVTDSVIDMVRYGFPFRDKGLPDYGPHFARNITMTNIGDDGFRNVHFVLNSSVDDVDPGGTSWHSDGFQLDPEFTWENVLVKNVSFANMARTALVFCSGAGQLNRRVSFVNIYCTAKHAGDSYSSSMISLRDSVFGLSLYHITVHYEETTPDYASEGIAILGVRPPVDTPFEDCQLGYLDVQGCHFSWLHMHGANYTPDPDYPYTAEDEFLFIVEEGESAAFEHNNYYNFEDAGARDHTPGSDVTTTDPTLDSEGRPEADSPLRNRLSTIIEHDLSGKRRGPTSDIGAYERLAGQAFEHEPRSLSPLSGV